MSDEPSPRELTREDLAPKTLPPTDEATDAAAKDLWRCFEKVPLDAQGRAVLYRDELLKDLARKGHTPAAAQAAIYREWESKRIHAQWRRFPMSAIGDQVYFGQAIALWTTAVLRNHPAPPAGERTEDALEEEAKDAPDPSFRELVALAHRKGKLLGDLLAFMEHRSTASFEDLQDAVWGKNCSDGSIREMKSRLNAFLESQSAQIRFRTRSRALFKDQEKR